MQHDRRSKQSITISGSTKVIMIIRRFVRKDIKIFCPRALTTGQKFQKKHSIPDYRSTNWLLFG